MTIENLLLAVQEKKQERLPFLLEKLINRITNPPVAVPNGCFKHTVLRDKYKRIGILRTMIYRNDKSRYSSTQIMDKVLLQYEEAGKAYHNAACTCADGLSPELLSATAICVSCGDQLGFKNSCRHPIHLSFKKGESFSCSRDSAEQLQMHSSLNVDSYYRTFLE